MLSPPLNAIITGNNEQDMTHFNKLLEEAIRTNLEQYWWGYRRFRTRPNGKPSSY